MADKKISQLTNLTGVNLAENDEFVLVDTSADETKAITFGELKTAFDTGTGFVRVTGDTMTGDLSFGDNDKAIFGAGSDLQIYHDGSNSRIQDTATGSLILSGTNFYVNNTGDSKSYLAGLDGGTAPYVRLYHDGAARLDTTSTGIDVTGTVTADGLTVDNSTDYRAISVETGINAITDVSIADGSSFFTTGGGGTGFFANDGALGIAARNQVTANSDIGFFTKSAQRMQIDDSGDISFYEDTGTTPKFFWDASAESLGIGDAAISNKLTLSDTADLGIQLTKIGSHSASIKAVSGAALAFGVDGSVGATERMRIDSLGNVGIGTSSPSEILTLDDTDPKLAFRDAGTERAFLQVDTSDNFVINNKSLSNLIFETGDTERMRIDSSGNVLVGKLSADFGATAGVEFRGDGRIATGRAGESAIFNRLTTDGDIALFRKDGTTVGSIGVINGDNLRIGGSATSHAGLQFGTDIIYPESGPSSNITDGLVDLGNGSGRFKDLYLSGGVYLGGTGAANKLDDYEEGTWTPTIRGSGTEGSYTATTLGSSRYTKVGDLVTVSAALANITEVTAGTGYMQITNLPFTKPSATYGSGTVGISYANLGYTPSSMNIEFISTSGATNVMYVYVHRDNANSANFDISDLVDGVTDIRFTVTYRAT